MKHTLVPLSLAALIIGLTACSEKTEAPAKPVAAPAAETKPAADLLDKATSAVKDTAQQAASVAQDKAQQATAAVKETVQDAASGAKDAVQQATTAVKDTVQKATAVAKDATQPATSSVTETAAKVAAKASELLGKAQTLVGQGKLQDAQDLLKSVSELKLTPEQQKLFDDLKAKVQQGLNAVKALSGDTLKSIPGLPK